MALRVGLVAAVLWLGASAAFAQPATDPETARQEADAIIAYGNAAGAFDNITDSGSPTIRHKASGLICRFAMDDSNHGVRLSHDARRHTDTVTCQAHTREGWNVSAAATGFTFNPTLEDAFGPASRGFRVQFRGAKPAVGAFAETSGPTPARTLRLTRVTDGRLTFARRQVAVAGRWVYVIDIDAPTAQPQDVDRAGADLARAALKDAPRLADLAPPKAAVKKP